MLSVMEQDQTLGLVDLNFSLTLMVSLTGMEEFCQSIKKLASLGSSRQRITLPILARSAGSTSLFLGRSYQNVCLMPWIMVSVKATLLSLIMMFTRFSVRGS